MSDPENPTSPFAHPFILPTDYELLKEVIAGQLKITFPNQEEIDAQFQAQEDILRVFGETEKAALGEIAGTEVCGLEIAYFFTEQFMTISPRAASDVRLFVYDLQERGVEDLDLIKRSSRANLMARVRQGLQETRILIEGLVQDPIVREDAEEYLISVQNATK